MAARLFMSRARSALPLGPWGQSHIFLYPAPDSGQEAEGQGGQSPQSKGGPGVGKGEAGRKRALLQLPKAWTEQGEPAQGRLRAGGSDAETRDASRQAQHTQQPEECREQVSEIPNKGFIIPVVLQCAKFKEIVKCKASQLTGEEDRICGV